MLETLRNILLQKGYIESSEGQFKKSFTNKYGEIVGKSEVYLVGKRGLLLVDMLLDKDGCIITSNEDRYIISQVNDLYNILK